MQANISAPTAACGATRGRNGQAPVGALAVLALLLVQGAAAEVTIAGKIDGAARAGDDFYRFANDAWLRQAATAGGRASLDTFASLRTESAQRTAALIEGAANGTLVEPDAGARAEAQMVGDYFAAASDTAAIEQLGLKALAEDLADIASISDAGSLAANLGRHVQLDDGTNIRTESLFGIWVHQGFHDSYRYAAHLVQGGLGLPDRDDYLDSSPAKAELPSRYQRHVASLLALAAMTEPEKRAARILSLETAIAQTHASRADTDDVFKTDNRWHVADFAARAPGFDWEAFFTAAQVDEQADIIVWQPSAVTGAAALATAWPLETWKDYLTLHLLEHYAAVLPQAFAQEHEALRSGLPASPPPFDRTKAAMASTNAALREAVGRLYCERYFPPESKATANRMLANILNAFRARIAAVSWMSPDTKRKALAKLEALRVGLGYPDAWSRDAGLTIRRGEALANQRRAGQFEYRRAVAKLTRPVDPAEWALAPQTVNAVINFSPNSLQFSAALLQPPLFDPLGDAASNYGSAGAGISHEIWHSFDELGRLYDDAGRLGDWWTAMDADNYGAATQALALQYSNDCPRPALCVHGQQVLTEAAADLIGLAVAHDAYLLSRHGTPDDIKDGLTGEQRFFLAFARRWRRVQTEESLRRAIETDTHPPPELRAATVRNLDAWYVAFGVKPGDQLYVRPEQRVRLP